jgi:hypothetical protein
MTIQTADTALINTTLNYTISATPQSGTGPSVSKTITVHFKDDCAGLVLSKPVWQSNNETFYLWTEGKLYFNKAVSSKPNCGNSVFTYKLFDASTMT